MREDDGTPLGRRGVRPAYDATEVRQGEIILKTPLRRAIFIGGLVGIVLLPLVLWLFS